MHAPDQRPGRSDGAVTSRHLDKHIDYDLFPQPASTRERGLATPQSLAFSPDGRTLFVAAFGSKKLGVFDVESLADDSFVPSAVNHIELSDGGPSGIAVGERYRRLYVYPRLGNSISIIDPRRRRELQSIPLHNPEPPVVTDGRHLLYDARNASSNGEAQKFLTDTIGDSRQPVVMFALEWCEFCWSARKMFAHVGIGYRSIDIDSAAYQDGDWGGQIRAALTARTDIPTIPQIFVGGTLVGGCTEAFDAWKEGRLQKMLTESGAPFEEQIDIDPYDFLPSWLHPR